ncbi:MAG: NADP-dependent oxidoreductase, partial [Proteobacteria bacterium]|nr:NADP-dependent oxidoreductase [Pseudomonadota bacterium]
MSDTATHVTLRRRPHGMASADDFEVVSVPMPTPGDGELLVRTRFLSLDPYMRGRMSDGPSYATPVAIGSPMVGAIVGDVIASRAPSVPVGTVVTTSG